MSSIRVRARGYGLRAVLLLCLAVLVLAACGRVRLSHAQSPAPRPMPRPATKTPVSDPREQTLHSLALAHRLTVARLADDLGSTDAPTHAAAANTILWLRDRYQRDAWAGINAHWGRNGAVPAPDSQDARIIGVYCGLLDVLRPSDPESARQAVSHIALVVNPRLSGVMDFLALPTAPMADLLERMSLPALPAMADALAGAPGVTSRSPGKPEALLLARAYEILGPATVPWLKDCAARETITTRRKTLRVDAAFLATNVTFEGTQLRELATPRSAVSLIGGYSSGGNGLNPRRTAFPASCLTPKGDADPGAAQRAGAAFWQLGYVIFQRVLLDDTLRSKSDPLYPEAAQADAIRVLGALRVDNASYAIWTHLRRRADRLPINQDASEETQACLDALRRIDIPAVRGLLYNIADEDSVKRQRAAAYALGRILGHYAVPFLDQRIADCLEGTRRDHLYQGEFGLEARQLRDIRVFGLSNGWFIDGGRRRPT